MNKQDFRKKYKQRREKLSRSQIEDASLAIANQVLGLDIWDYTNYHIFLSISEKNEVNTEYLLHILQGRDKSIIVPKTNFSEGRLTHILLQENTALQLSKYAIPEPISGIEISPEQIDVVFVPLLAYDTKGNRIGYGKGFYDGFLAKCSENTIFIGLSFFEADDHIIHNNRDVPLNYCVTPRKIYSF